MRKNILFLIFITIILSFALVACSSTTPPKDVVKEFLEALKTSDIEKAGTYLQSKDEAIIEKIKSGDELEQKAVIKILSHIDYEILSEQISGEEAKVKASITSLDLLRIVTKTMSELMPIALASAFSDENEKNNMDSLTEQYLMNAISDPDAPTTTTDVTINLKKIDGKWLIVSDENLLNSLTGNVGKAFEDFSK